MNDYNVVAWLWSNPSLKHWQRLALFWFYIPYLLWCYIVGKQVIIVKDIR